MLDIAKTAIRIVKQNTLLLTVLKIFLVSSEPPVLSDKTLLPLLLDRFMMLANVVAAADLIIIVVIIDNGVILVSMELAGLVAVAAVGDSEDE